jgi:hypothetical protein
MECCGQRYNINDCKLNRVSIDDSVLCAGNPIFKIGICFGDSGGEQGVYIIRWDFNEVFLFHVAYRKYLPLK